jgi:hypothetical protein
VAGQALPSLYYPGQEAKDDDGQSCLVIGVCNCTRIDCLFFFPCRVGIVIIVNAINPNALRKKGEGRKKKKKERKKKKKERKKKKKERKKKTTHGQSSCMASCRVLF